MKILRFILVAGGILLVAYGTLLFVLPQYRTFDQGDSNQTIGIFGIGILAILAGAFMKRRR
jgi:LPXTG-motif cell wall-anchored protein